MSKEQVAVYFEPVAAENARLAIASSGDLRRAISAILTLDGFFGTLHAELYEQGAITEPSDDIWKEELAQQNEDYRLLRDCAYALKHGYLTKPKPRLVRRSDQIFPMPASYDAATFDRSAFDVETIWIQAEDTDYRADEVIKEVAGFARERLSDLP
jgi:hypothetical protein